MLSRKETGYNQVKRQNKKHRQALIKAKEDDDIQAMRESMAEYGKMEFDVEVELKMDMKGLPSFASRDADESFRSVSDKTRQQFHAATQSQ